MKEYRSAFFKLSLSMIIFGSIGIFVRYIPLSSALIAQVRAIIGTIFLFAAMLIGRKRMTWTAVRSNLLLLLLSGTAIGFNWIRLFESYRYTSVAVSTLCYYMAPILVVLLSPLVLKEKLTPKKLLCVAAAVIGIAFVSGVFSAGSIGSGDITGMLLGLGAACLYAVAMLLNKKMHGIGSMDRTVLQLGISALVLLPYNILLPAAEPVSLDGVAIILLLVVGVVHTGLAYFLYFGSIEHMQMQSVAIISYLDPVFAVILSVLLLKEPISVPELLGAVLILGAASVSELSFERSKNQ